MKTYITPHWFMDKLLTLPEGVDNIHDLKYLSHHFTLEDLVDVCIINDMLIQNHKVSDNLFSAWVTGTTDENLKQAINIIYDMRARDNDALGRLLDETCIIPSKDGLGASVYQNNNKGCIFIIIENNFNRNALTDERVSYEFVRYILKRVLDTYPYNLVAQTTFKHIFIELKNQGKFNA